MLKPLKTRRRCVKESLRGVPFPQCHQADNAVVEGGGIEWPLPGDFDEPASRRFMPALPHLKPCKTQSENRAFRAGVSKVVQQITGFLEARSVHGVNNRFAFGEELRIHQQDAARIVEKESSPRGRK